MISENCIIAPTAKIGPDVVVEEGCFIDDNCIIGYPNPSAQNKYRTDLQSSNVKASYISYSTSKVIIKKNSILRSGTVVYEGCIVGENTDIAHNVIIREDTTLGENNYILSGTLLMNNVEIGSGCRIAGSLCGRTKIGNSTIMLGHTLHNNKDGVRGLVEEAPVIGSGVLIGREVSIVGGITIGDYSICGAGAVITKNVLIAEVWAGNPSSKIHNRTESEIERLKEEISRYE